MSLSPANVNLVEHSGVWVWRSEVSLLLLLQITQLPKVWLTSKQGSHPLLSLLLTLQFGGMAGVKPDWVCPACKGAVSEEDNGGSHRRKHGMEEPGMGWSLVSMKQTTVSRMVFLYLAWLFLWNNVKPFLQKSSSLYKIQTAATHSAMVCVL